MKFYLPIDKSLLEVEHVLLHRQVGRRLCSHTVSLLAHADIPRFFAEIPKL